VSGARDEVDFAAMVCDVWIINVWDTDVCNIDICGCYGRVANKHHMTYDAGYRGLICFVHATRLPSISLHASPISTYMRNFIPRIFALKSAFQRQQYQVSICRYQSTMSKFDIQPINRFSGSSAAIRRPKVRLSNPIELNV